MSFYRTAAGAKLDVVVDLGRRKLGFEVKFSNAPKVTQGSWQACEDVGVEAAYIVAPVETGWTIQDKVEVIGVMDIAQRLGRLLNASPPASETATYKRVGGGVVLLPFAHLRRLPGR